MKLAEFFLVLLIYHSSLISARRPLPKIIVYNDQSLYSSEDLSAKPLALHIYGPDRPTQIEGGDIFFRATDTGRGSELPTKAINIEKTGSQEQYQNIQILFLNNQRNNRTGAYLVKYAGAEIVAIKNHKNARFLPTNKTIRVNLEDKVTITMEKQKSYDPYQPVIWRKDGKIIQGWSSVTQVIHSAIISDTGIYECYQTEAQRRDGEIAMTRVIVRKCLPGRYNYPSCNKICRRCYNGGVCSDITGDCICPPGFKGTYCEKHCPTYRFDAECKVKCTSQPLDYNCQHYVLCLPDPFGCTCHGRYGLNCEFICKEGFYGPDCTQKCNCAPGKKCHPYTGECVDRSCDLFGSGGGSRSSCDIDYGSMCDDSFDGDSCEQQSTTHAVDFFNIRANPGSKTVFICSLFSGHMLDYVHAKLKSPTGHTYLPTNGSEMQLRGFVPMHVEFHVDQTEMGVYTCSYEQRVLARTFVRFYDLPFLKSNLTIVSVTKERVRVRWRRWTRYVDFGDGPIVQYRLSSQQQDKPREIKGHKGFDCDPCELTVGDLLPYTNYTFYLQVIRPDNGVGRYTASKSVVTLCDVLNYTPGIVKAEEIHAHEIKYVWQSAPCDEEKDRVTGYQVQFSDNKEFKSARTKQAKVTEHTETLLRAYTKYYFRVQAMTAFSHGDWSDPVEALTDEAQPNAPTTLRAICSDYSSVTFMWKAPSVPNGRITKYEITRWSTGIDRFEKEQQFPQVFPTTSTGDAPKGARYDGLKKNATYFFRVRAFTSKGHGEWSNTVKARTIKSPCPTNQPLTFDDPNAMDLAFVAAIFIGVLVTTTVVVVASVGYFGLHRTKSTDGKSGYQLANVLNGNKDYEPRDCGQRLSRYHQDTESLLNEHFEINSNSSSRPYGPNRASSFATFATPRGNLSPTMSHNRHRFGKAPSPCDWKSEQAISELLAHHPQFREKQSHGILVNSNNPGNMHPDHTVSSQHTEESGSSSALSEAVCKPFPDHRNIPTGRIVDC